MNYSSKVHRITRVSHDIIKLVNILIEFSVPSDTSKFDAVYFLYQTGDIITKSEFQALHS